MDRKIAIGITLLLLFVISASCSKLGSQSISVVQENDQLVTNNKESQDYSLPIKDHETVDNKYQLSAIYLIPPEGGQMAVQDIETFPEILIVNSFSELKENF